MDVFDLNDELIGTYEAFARSFTKIRSQTLKDQIETIYSSRRYWPEPLIAINPHFEKGDTIRALTASGAIHEHTAKIFGSLPRLYRHQQQALSKAGAKRSYVVTTGTGSGKSLCFFVPILDAAVRARVNREPPRTRAIIVYPMNALANSQVKELEKYIGASGLPEQLRPTYARYTGQDEEADRELIRKNKPDILLTNFMMLELLLTRQNARDRDVIDNASGLDFIVLDELHTYRGRQGADVAMLIRRLRDRVCGDKQPICIGTSATMATEGSTESKQEAVARVASRLFGVSIAADAVIGESLERATRKIPAADVFVQQLRDGINAPLNDAVTDAALADHPLAKWIELEIGLKEGQELERRKPTTLSDAARRLSELTSIETERCAEQLKLMLTIMSEPEVSRGGASERAFMAFKMHQFISGAGFAYSTAHVDAHRRITVEGQRNDPENPTAFLYPTFFCRECGQDYLSVSIEDGDGLRLMVPRAIDETPVEIADEEASAGYLLLEPQQDTNFDFDGSPERYPEDWVELAGGALRLKSDRRKAQPVSMRVCADGTLGDDGRAAWFLPGRYRFCLACRHQPAPQAREINKLAGLSAEGRSSSTTLITSTILRWMNDPKVDLKLEKRKLLGFTDNRQDAALQAGHFNDFMFVTLLRAGMLRAVRSASEGLGEEDFGRAVQQALGFVSAKESRRVEWMLNPEVKGPSRVDAERVMSRVLAHRVWADLRRGWRFTNPNLEDLGLIEVDYLGVDELAQDGAWASQCPRFAALPLDKRVAFINELFDAMRRALAVGTEALEPTEVEARAEHSRSHLREPWAISAQERTRAVTTLVVDAPAGAGARAELALLRAGTRSALARRLRSPTYWEERLDGDAYVDVINAVLTQAAEYGLAQRITTDFDIPGWRLAGSCVRLRPGSGEKEGNKYFKTLYASLASALDDAPFVFGLEGREHTAQVDQERREWREARFRWEEADRAYIASKRDAMRQAGEPTVFLPTLFCSPTMELGVDISALNAVYMRNAPPTPANYAQRSGRAGRSGQAALAVTYCAAQSPHDQYYFARASELVAGVVKPPALELANEDLIRAHLHAIWLGETAHELASDIPQVLAIDQIYQPLRDEVLAATSAPDLKPRAEAAMLRVLRSVENDLPADSGAWAEDLESFASTVAANAVEQFSQAFERWRQLYRSAQGQLRDANRISETPGITAKDRKEAKSQQIQANEQIALLERGGSRNGSDFYTYRYLATEGFLPGYNFPRLPVYAFVPSVGATGARSAYLQRARFLAIAEFGPQSLVYHEGRAFRVVKAKLRPDLRSLDDGKLTTSTLWVCDQCGAFHESEVERCAACDAPLAGVEPVHNVLRIDNVETRPAERITANDEERQRRGFDIQSVFKWPERGGRASALAAEAVDAEGRVLQIDYGAGATICRINKGLRRRSNQSLLGFGIDPSTGRWVKGPEDDADTDVDPDKTPSQRVVPIVQDVKNAALLRWPDEFDLSNSSVATIQHALTRGIEIAFELEEGEIQTEPTPTKDTRRAILAYEATEGGAGVLGRIARDGRALSRVARHALEVMHFTNIDAVVASGDSNLFESDPGAACVKGCYRCLLSYYNQPDHALLDRKDPDALRFLLRLARSDVAAVQKKSLSPWTEALEHWALPAPDTDSLSVGGESFQLVWRSHLVVAGEHIVADNVQQALTERGYRFVALPPTIPDMPPEALVSALGDGA